MKTVIRTPETHPLTWRLRDDKQPVWLDEYRSKNGYEGARKALTGLAPDEIVNQVKDAGLKGRGGAGFSTGLKWSLMPKDESMNIRYLLCNADEMEPGVPFFQFHSPIPLPCFSFLFCCAKKSVSR